MIKYITILFLAAATLTSCKKDSAEDQQNIAINATAYLGTEKATANIAIIPSSESAVIENENTIEAYFKALPLNSKNADTFTSQYSGYFAPGDYIIVIQLAKTTLQPIEKVHTYKRVTISQGNPSMENVMVFKNVGTPYYQAWVNKY